jgi:hypothetical protein
MTLVTLVTLSRDSTVTRGCARPRVTCARTFAEIGLLTEAKLSDVSRPCGRIFDRLCFWDSLAESGMIDRTPSESEAGVNVDKDGCGRLDAHA